ncbi:MAG: 50S ribosomal protein L22 [Steroidobacteraceae bacterium]
MEVSAKLRYARISPQKCRIVADAVRGKNASNALNILKFMPKKGARIVHKLLWSAVNNAENQNLDVDELKVSRVMVDTAPVYKRFAARAKGRGTRVVKRNSHITIVVSDGAKD